jgi:hypothetical protein
LEKAPSATIQIASDLNEDSLPELSCRPYKAEDFEVKFHITIPIIKPPFIQNNQQV